jgi:glycosyltransferase involved in cell wall biosynthesis
MHNPTDLTQCPTVSVVLATYNRSNLLPKAIESVLQQTFPDFELIIVDDGSTDNTAEIVSRYPDPRINYQPVKHGERSRARNIGIQLSRGHYIAFLDSDDWYLPDKLKDQVQILQSHPECGMTLGDWQIVNGSGEVIQEMRPWENYRDASLTVEDWLFHTSATPITVLIKREWFERGLSFDPSLYMSEDIELWMRLSLSGCKIIWTRSMIAVVLAHETNSLRDWPKVYAGRMEFLNRIFENPAVNLAIKASQDEIYARFHLGLAWLAFDSGLLAEGANELEKAITRFPDFKKDEGKIILDAIIDYSQYFLIRDPIKFVSQVFTHLPPGGSFLQRYYRETLGKVWMSRVWKANPKTKKSFIVRSILMAIVNRPAFLLNWGVFSLFIRAFASMPFEFINNRQE